MENTGPTGKVFLAALVAVTVAGLAFFAPFPLPAESGSKVSGATAPIPATRNEPDSRKWEDGAGALPEHFLQPGTGSVVEQVSVLRSPAPIQKDGVVALPSDADVVAARFAGKSVPGKSSLAVGPGAAPPSFVETEVPAGFRLPAAVLDALPGGSAPQADALDRIAEEFLESVEAAAYGNATTVGTAPVFPREAAWTGAVNHSNELYRSVFGVEAFNSWTTRAATEALTEVHR